MWTEFNKIVLSTLDVGYDDERVRNDPSITNPSLRLDKDLPKSTLKKVMDYRKSMELSSLNKKDIAGKKRINRNSDIEHLMEKIEAPIDPNSKDLENQYKFIALLLRK